jgi:hypothetical protein
MRKAVLETNPLLVNLYAKIELDKGMIIPILPFLEHDAIK